jgi:small subunit ribosomal protein S21
LIYRRRKWRGKVGKVTKSYPKEGVSIRSGWRNSCVTYRFLCTKLREAISLTTEPFGEFGGVFTLAEVRVQEGEPLENALRRFKRKVQTEDIIKEVKRHSFYLKPGEKKRVKEALARKRNRKKVRKEQD